MRYRHIAIEYNIRQIMHRDKPILKMRFLFMYNTPLSQCFVLVI